MSEEAMFKLVDILAWPVCISIAVVALRKPIGNILEGVAVIVLEFFS